MITKIILLLPMVAIIVPVCFRNWKHLLMWHIIVSVFLGYFFPYFFWAETPVVGGEVANYGLIILILHLLSSAYRGIVIFRENEHGIVMFPMYVMIASLAYSAIAMVIFLIGNLVIRGIL